MGTQEGLTGLAVECALEEQPGLTLYEILIECGWLNNQKQIRLVKKILAEQDYIVNVDGHYYLEPKDNQIFGASNDG